MTSLDRVRQLVDQAIDEFDEPGATVTMALST